MASKALIILIFLSALILPLSSLFVAENPHENKTPPSLEFLNHLHGCHKGDKLKDIHKLKKYLADFGYLNNNSPSPLSDNNSDDEFDDALESALKTYQLNYHLKPTGTLDSPTFFNMMMPRCGVRDIINGASRMRSGKSRHHHDHDHSHEGKKNPNFHIVAHYSFTGTKWSKSQLTYAFLPNTRNQAMAAVSRAFAKWQSQSHFTFSQVEDYRSADLTIGFGRGDHGDGHPFDGPGRVIAHAFQPEDGRFHYDEDETWIVGSDPNGFDLETIALHEIGHLLGLAHSSVPQAIMFPTIDKGETKGLHEDDIQGIRALYSV